MAQYKNFKDFKTAIRDMHFESRTEFLQKVKLAKVLDHTPYLDEPSARALVFAQEYKLIPTKHQCSHCEAMFTFEQNVSEIQIQYRWIAPRYGNACEICDGRKPSVATGTFFAMARVSSWLDLLDAMVMWVTDYPTLLVSRELECTHKKTDKWIDVMQKVALTWANAHNPFHDIETLMGDDTVKKKTLSMKKLRSMKSKIKVKRPLPCPQGKLKNNNILKKPAKAQGKFKKRLGQLILQVDEAHLNKKKPGKLSKSGRPQKDQVWLWGAVIQNHPERFVFRVLDHADDAFDGKPRGAKEIQTCLHYLGMPHHKMKKIILVSDKWLGTLKAVKDYKHEKRLTETSFPHKIVNHSDGEIINAEGYTTNAIEAKWSVLKRWVRKKLGGRLPAHSDREKWRAMISEYTYRSLASRGHSVDYDNTYMVPLRHFMQAVSTHSFE